MRVETLGRSCRPVGLLPSRDCAAPGAAAALRRSRESARSNHSSLPGRAPPSHLIPRYRRSFSFLLRSWALRESRGSCARGRRTGSPPKRGDFHAGFLPSFLPRAQARARALSLRGGSLRTARGPERRSPLPTRPRRRARQVRQVGGAGVFCWWARRRGSSRARSVVAPCAAPVCLSRECSRRDVLGSAPALLDIAPVSGRRARGACTPRSLPATRWPAWTARR